MERCIKKELDEQDDFPGQKPVLCNHEDMIKSMELEAHKAVQQMKVYRHMYRLSEEQNRRLQDEKRVLECRLAQFENDRRQGEAKSTCSSEDGRLFSRCDAETQTTADEVQEPPAKRRRSSAHHEESTNREVEHPTPSPPSPQGGEEQLTAVVQEPQPIIQSSNAAASDQADDRALLVADVFARLHGAYTVEMKFYTYSSPTPALNSNTRYLQMHLTAPTWEPPECRPHGCVLYHVAKLRLDNEVFESDELSTIKEAKENAAMKALGTLAEAWVVLNSA